MKLDHGGEKKETATVSLYKNEPLFTFSFCRLQTLINKLTIDFVIF